ncbi:hypothetical protein [Circoviridae sp.]|nr:hypothetical protein [Circoviridae sp.]UOF78162.1 hypothetical protein [Circoviridae sp.]
MIVDELHTSVHSTICVLIATASPVMPRLARFDHKLGIVRSVQNATLRNGTFVLTAMIHTQERLYRIWLTMVIYLSIVLYLDENNRILSPMVRRIFMCILQSSSSMLCGVIKCLVYAVERSRERMSTAAQGTASSPTLDGSCTTLSSTISLSPRSPSSGSSEYFLPMI